MKQVQAEYQTRFSPPAVVGEDWTVWAAAMNKVLLNFLNAPKELRESITAADFLKLIEQEIARANAAYDPKGSAAQALIVSKAYTDAAIEALEIPTLSAITYRTSSADVGKLTQVRDDGHLDETISLPSGIFKLFRNLHIPDGWIQYYSAAAGLTGDYELTGDGLLMETP